MGSMSTVYYNQVWKTFCNEIHKFTSPFREQRIVQVPFRRTLENLRSASKSRNNLYQKALKQLSSVFP
jgi:hypothetical protein